MTGLDSSSIDPPKPYIPATLSEIDDFLMGTIGYAPTFIDETGIFPDRTIDSEFEHLAAGFELVREKVGEERYTRMCELAVRAKALFAEDPEDTNGKTSEGIKLVYEITNVLNEVRHQRVRDRLPDHEGEVTGD
ncbi:MAG: hypothetical protein EOP94_04060 [Zymomonas sp.]|nr:MAG: hypothetical protein EOP94_04060 [Zymomonas sp.]